MTAKTPPIEPLKAPVHTPKVLPPSTRPNDPLRVLPTPLHMKTSTACQTNDWTTRAGYTVPNLCTSLEREMAALTHHAGIADLSPMGKYHVSGADAEVVLNHLLVANIAKLDRGDTLVSPMCQSNGKAIDLVTIARQDEATWWLTTDGRHMNWLEQTATDFNVRLEDCSDTHAGIMLAGPEVSSVLTEADLGDCTDIVLRGTRHIVWDGIEITLVHRTDDAVPGLSIWCGARDAAIVWNRLMDGGKDRLEAVGYMACEALRIDSGIPASGRDFVSDPRALRSDRSRSAIELGFDGLIDIGKGVFNGRAALLEERAKGSNLRLASLDFEGAPPQAGARLQKRQGRKDVIVGIATSTTSAPHRAGAKGLGFVVADQVAPGDVLEVMVEETRELLHISRRELCRVLSVAK